MQVADDDRLSPRGIGYYAHVFRGSAQMLEAVDYTGIRGSAVKQHTPGIYEKCIVSVGDLRQARHVWDFAQASSQSIPWLAEFETQCGGGVPLSSGRVQRRVYHTAHTLPCRFGNGYRPMQLA